MNAQTNLPRLRIFTFISLAFVVLTACTTKSDPMALRQTEDGNLLTYTTGAATRAISIRRNGEDHYVCAEPQPDASLDETEENNISIALINTGSDGGGNSDGIGEGSLGGRSANVLITREILYRFCEFVGNSNVTREQQLTLFNNVMATLVQINQTDHGTGTAGASSAGVTSSQTSTNNNSQTNTDTTDAGNGANSSGSDSGSSDLVE